MRHGYGSRVLGAALALVAVAGAFFGVHRSGLLSEDADTHWAMLERYCIDCHNNVERAGDLVLQGMTPRDISGHAEAFEAVARKLRGRLMPPPGGPQPAQAEIDAFVSWLERGLDRNAHTPRAGHVPVQRLDRTELAVAVKGLVGVEIEPAEYLPTEMEVEGFTNIAAALSISPAFLEQYVATARTVARLAVGEPVPRLASTYYPPPGGAQDEYVEGLPLGTRGGMRFVHRFPADGEYRISLTDLDVGLYPRAIETEQTVVVLIDRTEIFRAQLGGPEDLALVDLGGAPARAEIMERFADIPARVQAGEREVVVTFLERARAATEDPIYGFTPYGGFNFAGQQRVPRVVGGVDVVGPFDATGVSPTPSRAKIFICEPQSRDEERACAERITAELARRAFRRPIEQDDIDRLMPFYESGRAEGPGGFDAGIERVVAAILASPDFLYRTVVAPRDVGGAEHYGLSDLELASRLSFFLWSQGPDEELLELAVAGKLADPTTLQAQAERLLADPRAEALVTNFALRWLNLHDLNAVVPDERLFPAFSDELRVDFATELDLFLRSILLGDRNVQELLTADHTFVNERLARHYGIPSVHGPQFRRVTLEDGTRFGLLGKGAVLMRTSYGDRTSPVLRGAWVLEKLLGTPPAPPPPDVETDLTTPEGEEPTTIRARLEKHRADSSCNGCHGVIDPYGLALENFDAIGQWRVYDATADAPIDASEVLPTGAAVDGPVQLRDALMRRPEHFVQALTEKLMMYALGRELEYHDMPQVRAIVRAAARHEYRLSAIVAGVVTSDAFRLQALPHGRSGDDPHALARAAHISSEVAN